MEFFCLFIVYIAQGDFVFSALLPAGLEKSPNPINADAPTALSLTNPRLFTTRVNMATYGSNINPTAYVGFDTITHQIERRLLKRGFQFNIMLVGQSGLGKTTLVNTLFASHVADSHGRKSVEEPLARTPEITTTSKVIVENDVHLKLNVIDTPGYGDQVNNEKCWEPLVKYIKDQHSFYLRKELTAQREKHFDDTRVHCVLFFIQPNGHGLKPLDLVVLRKLSEIANVVPVIAKSDSFTIREREQFKQRVQQEFIQNRLSLYPYDNEEHSKEEQQLTEQVRSMLPFAVVGSETIAEIDGRAVPVRRNKWGVVNIANENHCEFPQLKAFLITTNLQDLIETTALKHYEGFRSRQLLALKESTAPKKK